MDHTLPLISTLALAFGLALVFGYFAERLRFPALVGYLFAGVLCSAHTPGPVADMELASQLSELGVTRGQIPALLETLEKNKGPVFGEFRRLTMGDARQIYESAL